MDTVLISVTLISLALAGAMGALVARMLRDERRRSDARVEALIELASEQQTHVPETAMGTPRPAERTAPVRPAAAVVAPRLRTNRERSLDDFEIRPSAAAPVAEIFAEPARSSPWGRRFAVIGALAAVGGALIFGAMLRDDSGPEPTTTTGRAAATPAAPLELVSLRHSQEGATLTITGLVKNPEAGAPLTRITVTAVALAPDGSLVASGKAPLDYTSIGPGDESPFVVTVPVRGAVARYRVGFRSEDGSVVAHIDRRAADVSRAGL